MKQKNKILILGGNGMAGHTIALYLSESGYNVTITTRNPIILYSKIKKII